MNRWLSQTAGFTLLEVVVVLGIFSIVTAGATALVITSIRSNAIIWEQLAAQNDGRQVLQEVTDDVRRAEVSSVGSYPVQTASEHEFIFFANVDNDSDRERVRYTHVNGVLEKGIIKATGTPLEYVTDTETVRTLASGVQNLIIGEPTFLYYDEGYTGTSTALSAPVNIVDVRMVRVLLELQENTNVVTEPLHVEALVQLRNLKQN